MISVEEAEKIILAEARGYGAEIMPFELAMGRVLAEDIIADRDLPPFNRVMVDGIAVKYQAIANGICSFHVKATQAAGYPPVNITEPDECIEIMTGAALPACADTVIRYEDLEMRAGIASIIISGNEIRKGQHIHSHGSDKKRGDILVSSGHIINPPIISSIASVGETELRVKKLPRVIIISTGDELVSVDQTPLAYQIRRSNSYMLKAALEQHNIHAGMIHIPDNPEIMRKLIQECLQNFDVLLISGGVSMGKSDHIPNVLADVQVQRLFHKVKQRPGKPFWFGKHGNGAVVFAFPGNPVAALMCLHRYFVPWLQLSIGFMGQVPAFAVLGSAINFEPDLSYFLQVKLHTDMQGQLIASPISGNGSGDFANLAHANAFMEFPSEKNDFRAGEVYRVWPI